MKTPLLQVVLFLILAAPLPAATFDLSTATIADINDAFDAGALTSEKLVQLYLARIEAYDKQGPEINAVIALNPHAVSQARALDAERRATGPRSPMHGIPVVVKDLVDVVGLPTTGGFKPFGKAYPPRNSTVAQKLIDAGAIILAKVNTTNWWGRGFDETHVLGPTLNPYNTLHDCSGSSNGTGASITAWFATAGLGTDTGSSVQGPSAICGLAGMVASHGMVSRAGTVPQGAHQDRVGPMCRSVHDVAVMLSVISGWDSEDLTTYHGVTHFPKGDWSHELRQVNLQGRRIGVLREMIHTGPDHAEAIAIFDMALADMRAAGAFIVDPVLTGFDLKNVTKGSEARTAEFEKIHTQNAYLARLGSAAPFKSMQDMVAQVGREKFSPRLLEALDRPRPDRSEEYLARLDARVMIQQIIADAVDKYDLDCLVLPYRTIPALPWAGPRHPESSNNLTSNSGLPAVITPCGYTAKNLPIALQFIGTMHDDLTLLQVAYGYEQAVKPRRPPGATPPLAGEVFEYRSPGDNT
jgi:Asp-tRNA(Asn)/Glu-tRNA(Gln) amidotransferase A subunit family amidase